jgi:oxygen-independent coproporphyrinogen-3 oxidase
LKRRHRVEEARNAVRWAREAGFDNVGCDLLFGLPGQTLDHHLRGLQRLIDLQPDHISTYCLTLARSSRLYQNGFRPADDELSAEMMERGRDLLGEAGYPQYEVSNYAGPRHQVRHNNALWAGGPYLGLGAGAHSLRWSGRTNLRTHNPQLAGYREGVAQQGPWSTVPGGQNERVAEARARFETSFLGLRTTTGIDRRGFRQRFGHDLVDSLSGRLEALVGADLLEVTQSHLRPTERGIWFADELAVRLG